MPPNNQTPTTPTPPIPPPYQPGQMGGSLPSAQTTPSSAGSPKQQIVERLKQANNILVTVSNNPSVDQLAACVGLTLLLNRLGKHATAVFSGAVPSTLEFLQPEKTIEKNTDSLRDFIIALDKAKADKLRYKVEDRFVKIFITPYKTSLSEKDLEFSQGDFNVEVVIALGVHRREELDQAITAHGRILHDATVISVNNQNSSELGVINWHETGASSLSELLVGLAEILQPGILDAQMATAFLTGIVAETQRFSNTKTSAVTMGIASQLMRAGANQQLIATKLEEPAPIVEKPPQKDDINDNKPPQSPQKPPEPPKKDNGSLQILHDDQPPVVPPAVSPAPLAPTSDETGQEAISKIQIDKEGTLTPAEEASPGVHTQVSPKIVLTPPSMGGTLTANTSPENLEPSSDPLSLPPVDSPLLSRSPSTLPSSDFGTNTNARPSNVDEARQSVNSAEQKNLDQRLEPVAALGAQPVDLEKKKGGDNGNDENEQPASSAPPVPPPMVPPNQ